MVLIDTPVRFGIRRMDQLSCSQGDLALPMALRDSFIPGSGFVCILLMISQIRKHIINQCSTLRPPYFCLIAFKISQSKYGTVSSSSQRPWQASWMDCYLSVKVPVRLHRLWCYIFITTQILYYNSTVTVGFQPQGWTNVRVGSDKLFNLLVDYVR